ncbi:nickel pincer cofactor biosynthesis protein LarB [Candidatus Aerophobetes bacterium]|nr:nickel pincer cofactor biosynthesis protein LarB [Candidatus Aerophobetes bacterium]
MNRKFIEDILKKVQEGTLQLEQALEKLREFPFEDIGFVRIDHHRELRRGFPEVIFCQGKSIFQIKTIAERLWKKKNLVVATRADEKIYQAIKEVIPEAVYYPQARIVSAGEVKPAINKGKFILIISAGTGDIPVAEEAKVTAELMGNKVETLYDVGVAGIHRLLEEKKLVLKANVLVVVAGMEGALPGVVGGLVDKPVIAVPTSIGYGASFGGVSPLLTMLTSCSPGIAVVNIDNGFGAGYLASLINNMNIEVK